MVMHKYTEEEKLFLKEFVPGHSHKEITQEFNINFGTTLTEGQIKSSIGRYKLNTGRTGRFEKGHLSHNKGKKGVCAKGCEKTWFQKGNIPHNTKDMGYERVTKDGYIEVKILDKPDRQKHIKNFIQKHRLIWEAKNGPIPKGYVIIFLDGNPKNCVIENLACISRAEHLEMTRKKLRYDSAELSKIGVSIAKASVSCNKRKKEKNYE